MFRVLTATTSDRWIAASVAGEIEVRTAVPKDRAVKAAAAHIFVLRMKVVIVCSPLRGWLLISFNGSRLWGFCVPAESVE